MFSRFQRFWTQFKVITDIAVLAVAFMLAYVTRFYGPFAHESLPEFRETLITLGTVLVIYPVTFYQSNLYFTNRSRSDISEVFELFKALITATLILGAFTFFFRDRFSRLTLLLFTAYAFVLVAATRLIFRAALHSMRRRGFNLKSIMVVGAGALGRRVIDTIENHTELGFRVTGVLTRKPEKVGKMLLHAPILGTLADLEKVMDERPVDQVIIALPLEDQLLVKDLMERLALRTVDVKVVPDLYQYITLCGGLEEFGGLPIINLQTHPMNGWNLIAKRLFDMLFALFAIAVSAPVMAVTALMVRLTSPGPILYKQERMGMDGRTFNILKFRTMRMDAESSGAQMASAGDARTTLIGAAMRRLSIDELPQFFNVLVGDMSLVGPRPERPVFIEEFKKQIPRYHLRHKVKAGITGWAQINGLRGQTSIEKRIEYDLYYIENWSLLLDLKILLRTALGGFLSKNAY